VRPLGDDPRRRATLRASARRWWWSWGRSARRDAGGGAASNLGGALCWGPGAVPGPERPATRTSLSAAG
jgi:hypothetical protein